MDEARTRTRTLQNDDQVAWDVTIVREKPGRKRGGTKNLKRTDQKMHESPAYKHTLPRDCQYATEGVLLLGPPTSREGIDLMS